MIAVPRSSAEVSTACPGKTALSSMKADRRKRTRRHVLIKAAVVGSMLQSGN
jgi:hypothetical protein